MSIVDPRPKFDSVVTENLSYLVPYFTNIQAFIPATNPSDKTTRIDELEMPLSILVVEIVGSTVHSYPMNWRYLVD
ncbi:unnamed protein product [Ilex paraguariensis]|uniref:Uncharacterized protein n=1 Tax=Ilex paraguariensis TaxID=185542 RepID=A0ABC8UX19_9AQUA